MANHYQTLEVPYFASYDVIKTAWKSLAIANHPDKGGDLRKSQAINGAWATLKKESSRLAYDSLEIGKLKIAGRYEEGFTWVTGLFQRLPESEKVKEQFVIFLTDYAYKEHQEGNKEKSNELIEIILNHKYIDDKLKERVRSLVYGDTKKTSSRKEGTTSKKSSVKYETNFVEYELTKNDKWFLFFTGFLRYFLFGITWVFWGVSNAFFYLVYITLLILNSIVHMADSMSNKNNEPGILAKGHNFIVRIVLIVIRFIINHLQEGINWLSEKGQERVIAWEYRKIYGK